jgi:hypothetical protein
MSSNANSPATTNAPAKMTPRSKVSVAPPTNANEAVAPSTGALKIRSKVRVPTRTICVNANETMVG